MFAVIFEVQPKTERFDDYLGLAKQLKPRLEAVDGFIDNERFASRRTKGRVLSPFLRRQLSSDSRQVYRSAQTALRSTDPAGLKGVWRIADLERVSLSDKEMDRCWRPPAFCRRTRVQ